MSQVFSMGAMASLFNILICARNLSNLIANDNDQYDFCLWRNPQQRVRRCRRARRSPLTAFVAEYQQKSPK